MIDETRFNELMQDISINDTDEAFLGAMPAGECTFIGVLDETRNYEGNKWIPVQFKVGTETYELSLKGLVRAEGLEYSTRNYKARARMWVDGTVKAKTKFPWKGKETRSGIRKRDTAAGKAGTEYTLNVYTFDKKKVG